MWKFFLCCSNKIIEKRNLNEKQEIKFNNYIKKTELFLKRNKNISFNRKLEYDHNMPVYQ